MGAEVVVFSFEVPIEASEGALLNRDCVYCVYTREPLFSCGSYCSPPSQHNSNILKTRRKQGFV